MKFDNRFLASSRFPVPLWVYLLQQNFTSWSLITISCICWCIHFEKRGPTATVVLCLSGACRICLTQNSLVALCAGGWCGCTRYHCWRSSYRPCWKKATGTCKSVRCDCSLMASVSCLLPHFLDITWHQLGTWSSKVRDGLSCFSNPREQNIVSISSNMFGLLASRLWVLCSCKWWGVFKIFTSHLLSEYSFSHFCLRGYL